MPRVKIPGVGVVTFPNTMTPDQIDDASRELYDGAKLTEGLKQRGFPQKETEPVLEGVSRGPAAISAGPGAVQRKLQDVGTALAKQPAIRTIDTPMVQGGLTVASLATGAPLIGAGGRVLARGAGRLLTGAGAHPFLTAGALKSVGMPGGFLSGLGAAELAGRAGTALTRLGQTGPQVSGLLSATETPAETAAVLARAGRLVLTPAELAQRDQLMKLAAEEAARQGMRTAAYGTRGFQRGRPIPPLP